MKHCFVLIVPKRITWLFFILLFCFSLFGLSRLYPFGLSVLGMKNQEITFDIMLDPGHGGIDPGAIGVGELYEKHYVLDIVLQMEKILTRAGLKVGLTRYQDTDVSHLVEQGTRHRRDLLGRLALMNKARVGLSVHANATKNPDESGALVFYQKDNYLDWIFAQIILEELERVQVLNEKRPVPRSTLLLLKAGPPVLLVEVGFMSNPTDLSKLQDPQFRTNVALALSEGILQFFDWRFAEQSEI